MKASLFSLLLLFSFVSLHGQSTLAYQWKPNASYKFKATIKDKVSMGGGGMMGMMAMAGDMEFTTNSIFTLRISSVNADGTAAGTFFLNNFRVSDNRGNTLANMASLPARAIKADFTVNKKGDFTFNNLPMLVVREGGNLLVSSKVSKDGMASSTTAQVGGEKVTLFAEFNPKTGTLKGGYTAQTIGQPKPKPVTLKEDDETLDLIPTDFLDLLSLPEGRISAGQTFRTRMYDTEITQKVQSFEQNVAKVNFDIKSAINAQKFEQDAKKMAGDDDMDTESDMDMGDMDMPAGMGGGKSGIPNIAQETSGNFTLDFDNAKGMMNAVNGTINTNMNMMGMEMKTNSKLSMSLVP